MMHVNGQTNDAQMLPHATFLFIRDSVAGLAGATTKLLSGHPLDTLKVRMQTRHDLFQGLWQSAVTTFRHEGIFGFYRGLSTTIPGVMAYNSLLFARFFLLTSFDFLKYARQRHPSVCVFHTACWLQLWTDRTLAVQAPWSLHSRRRAFILTRCRASWGFIWYV